MNLSKLTNKIMEATTSEEPTDFLPLLRDNIDIIYHLCDKIIMDDIQPQVFQHKHKLQVIDFCHADDKLTPMIGDWEPDYVIYAYYFKDYSKEPTVTTIDQKVIMDIIATILISDCSGCCNALEFININKYGIISRGNVGSTYHS